MDEDEAKSIASDWIRRLEASLLAKISDTGRDNTIPGDHICHLHHQNDSVSNSFSHDDLERQHIDIVKTSSDEKIHHEATGLPSGKDRTYQKVDITNDQIKSPYESISKSTVNTTCNGISSPRIDIGDLRRKRLERFENTTDSSTKFCQENGQYCSTELEKAFQSDGTAEDDMLQYEASSLGMEGNSLRDGQWKLKRCNYEVLGVNSDEDDKLRLELWGLRGAVESGQLDIDSYLGPLYSKTKNSSFHSENGIKEEPISADLKAVDSTSVSQYCSKESGSPSRDSNFNIKNVHPNQDTSFAKCPREEKNETSTWKSRNGLSKDVPVWNSSFSPSNDVNGVENSHCDNSREDFTSFSVTKPSGLSGYGNVRGPWSQIEGKLYNGFETSDSESSVNAPNVPHNSKSKSNFSNEKSDPTKSSKIKPLKSGKGKQKILSELTEFLDSERSSKRAAKEGNEKSQTLYDELRCLRSPVLSVEDLSDSLLLHEEPSRMNEPVSSPNVEVSNSTYFTQGCSLSSESRYSETNLPQETGFHPRYGNSDVLSLEKSNESSTLEETPASSGTQMAKVCNACHEVNSKAANWCIECGTALIKVEPVLLSSEQQSKYEEQCQETKNFIAKALNSNKPEINGSTTMSKVEKDLCQDVLRLSKEVDKNAGFSNKSLRSNLCNYKRRWLKSSIAWSSFEPQELSKPPSIVKTNGKENERKMNGKKESKNLRSRSSSDLSAAEGSCKKHGNKNGHSRAEGRHRTTSANYHSADDYDIKNTMSINLELSNQERSHRNEAHNKERPGSAKSSTKIQRTKPQRKRPESAKPRTYSQPSSPDLPSLGKEDKSNGRKSARHAVHVPQLKLDGEKQVFCP
jgi:hypothetical protein